jgi:hypothetical protein
MKLTKETLKQIIKEELEAVMSEANAGNVGGSNRQTSMGGGTGIEYYDTKDKRAKDSAAFKSGQDHKQSVKDAEDKFNKAQAELKQLAKRNRQITQAIIGELDAWKVWRQAKEAWRKSDKTRNEYTQTIGKVLIDQLDNQVKHLARRYKSADLVEKVAYNWYLSQEAKYEAEIKQKGRSFMQKAGSFLTGKGFKEE